MTRLRILMVCHMPWDRNLGGPRVQVELADEFLAAGHTVEKFSYEDAFPNGRSETAEHLDPRAFGRRAAAFIRRRAGEFDVVDAHQGNLPYSKESLGFRGLLVARSVGLYALYAAFARKERAQWPERYHGSRLGRAARRWRDWRSAASYLASLRCADLINVCNPDEQAYVSNVIKLGGKCVTIPFGLSAARKAAFQAARTCARHRLAYQTVAFIGYWAPRKGSFDWGDITRRVWASRPATRFLFLGTGRGADAVRTDLGIGRDDRVVVVPSYPTDDLPALLREASVGAFPSYIEGFGFGVLEMIAAGLPTVAYDVFGSGALARLIGPGCLAAAGDTGAFATRLTDLLGSDPFDYARLSRVCEAVADGFTWPAIARDTLSTYEARLADG